MKRLVFACVLVILLTACQRTEYKDYYGYEAPRENAEIFAEGTFSLPERLEYPPSFAEDLSSFYFSSRSLEGTPFIMEVKRNTKGEWSSLKAVSFTGTPEMEPILSPDGEQLFFAANSEFQMEKPHDLYVCNREDGGWGQPTLLPESINSDAIEYYASATIEKTLYFTREGDGIYRSEWDGSSYEEAQKIEAFDDYSYASHPFVAPDESFVIFDARHSDGFGSADLYIAFRDENGDFTQPVNLGGKINTHAWDAMGTLSPDGSILFFSRENSSERDVYWLAFDPKDYRSN